jgi:Fe-S cluster assembly protein SufD
MIASAAKSPLQLEVAAIPGEPAWLTSARQAALARFSETGLPTVKDEDWRFTNLAPIASLSFDPVPRSTRRGIAKETLARLPFNGLDGSRLVFVNGRFSPELSSIAEQEGGVKILGLADALAGEPTGVPVLIERHLFRVAQEKATPFASLNAALFQDGAFIHIPKGRKAAGPVHLFYISTPDASGQTASPRSLIIAEAGTSLTITESYLGVGDARYLTNSVTELIVGDDATMEYLKFQDESSAAFHLATLAVSAGRDSHVRLHSMAFGAKLSRTNIHAMLAGEGAECVLNGLYLVSDEQLADHYMIVDHAVPRCVSHEYFNGIMAGKSKGVFHGRIIVRPDAQKTDAKQTNKNLLLSDDATVDTKPQLEIYADDVKCTHGATVGQLSDEAIFYLRSRGIPLEKARQMLIYAFAGEIIDRILCELLRRELNERVWNRLEQNQSTDANPSCPTTSPNFTRN